MRTEHPSRASILVYTTHCPATESNLPKDTTLTCRAVRWAPVSHDRYQVQTLPCTHPRRSPPSPQGHQSATPAEQHRRTGERDRTSLHKAQRACSDSSQTDPTTQSQTQVYLVPCDPRTLEKMGTTVIHHLWPRPHCFLVCKAARWSLASPSAAGR